MTIYSNKPEMVKEHYVDVESWLKNDDVEGHPNHPSLVQSYRKAAVSETYKFSLILSNLGCSNWIFGLFLMLKIVSVPF